MTLTLLGSKAHCGRRRQPSVLCGHGFSRPNMLVYYSEDGIEKMLACRAINQGVVDVGGTIFIGRPISVWHWVLIVSIPAWNSQKKKKKEL